MRIALAAFAALLLTPTAAQEFYVGAGLGGLTGKFADEFGGAVRYNGASISGFVGAAVPFEPVTVGAEVGGEVNWTARGAASVYGYPLTGTVGRLSLRTIIGLPADRFEPYIAAGPAVVFQRHKPQVGNSEPEATAAHLGAEVAIGVSYALDPLAFMRIEVKSTYTLPARYNLGMGEFTADARDLVSASIQVGRTF